MLKRLGREARIEIERFIESKVFLETFVKVDKDWRGSESKLKKYGYKKIELLKAAHSAHSS